MRKTDNPQINKNLLETLCGYQAKEVEILAILKVDNSQLTSWIKKEYNKSWEEFYKEYSALGKVKIRENQMNLSKKSPEMAKHLGEKYLDDTQKATEPEQNFSKIEQKIVGLLLKDPDYLKLKQNFKSFINFYILSKNATQSAIQAGYAKESGSVQGSRLLANDKIKKILVKYNEIELDSTQNEKEELIEDLKHIKDTAISAILVKGMATSAVAAIKQISVMRGYDAPTSLTSSITISEVLKAQEEEGTLEL